MASEVKFSSFTAKKFVNHDSKTGFGDDAADQAFVNRAATQEEKKNRAEMIGWLTAFNGSLDQTVGGVAKSYIPKKAFYQQVVGLHGNDLQITECALNYRALDKGSGGVFGANLRWALRDYFVPQRECVVHRIDANNIPAEVSEAVDEYIAAFGKVKDVTVHVVANAANIVALGGALMMSVGHHFDSQNTKPQTALLSALGLKDDISGEDIRKVCYLAVHPVPLEVSERLRKEAASGEVVGYSEAVKIRSNGVPAGYANVAICNAALQDLKGEKYWGAIAQRHGAEFRELEAAVAAMKANPAAYHVLASDFGKKRIVFDVSTVKVAMTICCAYVMEIVKGSMAEAASIKKFYNMNSRQVSKWRNAFALEAEKAIRSINDLLA